jgi:hypothetical protein
VDEWVKEALTFNPNLAISQIWFGPGLPRRAINVRSWAMASDKDGSIFQVAESLPVLEEVQTARCDDKGKVENPVG